MVARHIEIILGDSTEQLSPLTIHTDAGYYDLLKAFYNMVRGYQRYLETVLEMVLVLLPPCS